MKEDVFYTGSRWVRRSTYLGEEGGTPPILLVFEDDLTGESLGFYSCDKDFKRVAMGPMFETAK